MKRAEHTRQLASHDKPKIVSRVLVVTLLLLAVSGLLIHAPASGANTTDGKPSSALYAAAIAETYDFKFGPNPFAPSNANTTTGTFIPGDAFVPSTRCGTCHTDAHAQWRQSAHGNAFREPFYQKNVKDLQKGKFSTLRISPILTGGNRTRA